MTTNHNLKDIPVNVKVKLASLWTSFMFMYIYVDYFALYMPNKIADITNGKVYVLEINQTFLLAALVSLTIPSLLIFLSTILPAKANKTTNLIAAVIYIPYTLFNLSGEAWAHMIFAATIEVGILLLIIYHAAKWPRVKQ